MKPILLALNYNNKKFLDDFLKSLADQNVTDWDVYLLDDSSTDISDYALEKLISSYGLNIQYLRNERNFGINKSILNFLDGRCIDDRRHIKIIATDDIIALGALEITRLNLTDEIDLLYSDTYEIDNHGNVCSFSETYNEKIFCSFRSLFLFNNYYPATSSVVRVKFLRSAILRYPQVLNVEDWPLLIEISLSRCVVRKIPYPVTYYRRHNESLSNQYYKKEKNVYNRISEDVQKILLLNLTLSSNVVDTLMIRLRLYISKSPKKFLKFLFLINREYQLVKFLEIKTRYRKVSLKFKSSMKYFVATLGMKRKKNYEHFPAIHGDYCINDLIGRFDDYVYEEILKSQHRRYLGIFDKIQGTIGSSLDYGCGTGKYADFLKKLTTKAVTGFDPCSALLVNNKKYNTLLSDRKFSQKYDLVFVHNVIGGMNKHEFSDFITDIKKVLHRNTMLMIVDVCSQDSYTHQLSWRPVDFENLFNLMDMKEIFKDYVYEHSNRLRISIARFEKND